MDQKRHYRKNHPSHSFLLKTQIASGTIYLKTELGEFFRFIRQYAYTKLLLSTRKFESHKNTVVKSILIKRGRRNRMFLHVSAMAVLTVGIVISPMLTDSNPFSQTKGYTFAQSQDAAQSLVSDDVFNTQKSDKPRDKIISYTVQHGDTISTIAKKFGISEDTIKWQNNLSSDEITVGDTLQILPVTGIAHKVESGDTVYTIAKKYNTDAQQIVDYPFNDFANPQTFSLVVGEILVVPNGVAPQAQSTYKVQDQYIAVNQGSVPVSHGGWFFPVQGLITQYASWYHMALDIAGSVGTPIYPAHSGTVERVSVGSYDTGYGNNVWVSDGDGVETHYAHLDSVNVSVGQSVVGGQTIIGTRGNTGRSTGPHTHFEIRVNGALVNPLTYVSP